MYKIFDYKFNPIFELKNIAGMVRVNKVNTGSNKSFDAFSSDSIIHVLISGVLDGSVSLNCQLNSDTILLYGLRTKINVLSNFSMFTIDFKFSLVKC